MSFSACCAIRTSSEACAEEPELIELLDACELFALEGWFALADFDAWFVLEGWFVLEAWFALDAIFDGWFAVADC